MTTPDKFLIWSNEHRAWWKPNETGYTVERDEAGTYSYDDAITICRNANEALVEDDVPNETMVPVEPPNDPDTTGQS